MNIAGYEPLTLIDYPDHLATIVFTPGCALRCPYCHNPELISPQIPTRRDAGQAPKTKPADAGQAASALDYFTKNREQEFFEFLGQRRGILDGVVITGGEPTLQPDLVDFIRHVKDMGFLVKLDTNGIFPDIVEKILETKLVDYWAMDIKHAPEKYHLAVGLPAEALAKEGRLPLERFQQSVKLLMSSGVPYEFRTTVVPSIHTPEDFLAIGEWIRGARAYYLQAYRPIKVADETLNDRIAGHTLNLPAIRESLLPYLDVVEIRD
jgi:pyruvate formate lyase activating enzyme